VQGDAELVEAALTAGRGVPGSAWS
jgi:hypothetical protein